MTPLIDDNRQLTQRIYDWCADSYLRSLPLEHFMESIAQATQREITLESLALVRAVRPDFHVFSELLIQYPLPEKHPMKPERVVPDNMVVIWPEPIKAPKAYHLPLQPVGPSLVMEYVSQSNRRKDYEDNIRRYHDELKVPYYLIFDPEEQKLELHRCEEEKYVSVVANDAGRLAMPDLELEVAILEGWMRFWHRGVLLPLPGELLNQLRAKNDQLDAAREHLREKDLELARLREELARLKAQS